MNDDMELNLPDGSPIPDPLPEGLLALRVRGSPTRVLPRLPTSVVYVSAVSGALEAVGDTAWGELARLETLDLSLNSFTRFEIDAPPALAALHLAYNPVAHLDLRFASSDAVLASPLVTLDLEGCRLGAMPACLRSSTQRGGDEGRKRRERLPALADLRLKHNPIWYVEYSDIAPSRVNLESIAELADATAYAALSTAAMRRARYHLREKARDGEVDAVAAMPWYTDIDAAEVRERAHAHFGVTAIFREMGHTSPATTHTNPQNVHLPSNQHTALSSIAKLRTLRAERAASGKADPSDEALVAEFVAWHVAAASEAGGGIMKSIATALCAGLGRRRLRKSRLPPWAAKLQNECARRERHSTFGLRTLDMMGLVLGAARSLDGDARNAVFAVLKDEVVDGDGLCFTGRLSRLANALGGFVEGVGVHLSPAEEIANAIARIRAKNAAALGEDSDPYLARTIADVQALLAEGGHAEDEAGFKTKAECDAWIDAL